MELIAITVVVDWITIQDYCVRYTYSIHRNWTSAQEFSGNILLDYFFLSGTLNVKIYLLDNGVNNNNWARWPLLCRKHHVSNKVGLLCITPCLWNYFKTYFMNGLEVEELHCILLWSHFQKVRFKRRYWKRFDKKSVNLVMVTFLLVYYGFTSSKYVLNLLNKDKKVCNTLRIIKSFAAKHTSLTCLLPKYFSMPLLMHGGW